MIKTKILIVEDETIIALDIQRSLTKTGFEVTDAVTNHDDAIESVKKNKPDMILMDIHLENSQDGIQTAQDIQKIENVPIIYLTSFHDEDTTSRAVKTNPVQYLIKPFNIDQLKTTINLALYKINQPNQSNIDINCVPLGFDYYYDIEKNLLFYKNRPIKLSQHETLLLSILINAKGAVVSFEELEYQIWPDSTIKESGLRTLIYRTRSKLEYKLIETVPTFGCKLTAII